MKNALGEPNQPTCFLDGGKGDEWSNERIYDVPSNLKFTVKMGNWATKSVDGAAWPQDFQIDYVRVGQLADCLPDMS
ncbi:hypothetical protein [Cerasicoccus frondis]|uniref:hypothetical protein n=1 Tax=Cerasicoccus frondis TaxID=490090 RepID=UPI0028527D02|nr:hypothetical protein [Cerasicoccus frondis]